MSLLLRRPPGREEIMLVSSTTGIVDVSVDKPFPGNRHACYNLSGQQVDKSYHGIVIKDGIKYVQ